MTMSARRRYAVWPNPRSNVKVKVTVIRKLRKWPISKSVSSASMHVIKRLVIYNSYFFRTEIRYSSSFSVTWPSKLGCYEESTSNPLILDPDLDSTRIWMHWATLDAILICFELPPLLPPILDQSLLTVLLQFTSRDPSWSWTPEPPSAMPVEMCAGDPFVSHVQANGVFFHCLCHPCYIVQFWL